MLKEKWNTIRNNEIFLKILRATLCIFAGAYFINAFDYIVGRIYNYTEHIIDDAAASSGILYFIKIRYYYEAAGLRFMLNLFVLTVLSVLILVIYRRFLSKPTKILTATTLVPPALYILVFYMSADESGILTEFKTMWFIIIAVILCIAHAISTVVFLIKDVIAFDECE